MTENNSKSFKMFESIMAKTEGTYIFDKETSVQGFGVLFEVIKEMGLNPMKTEDLLKTFMSLFNIEFINMPDLSVGRYIFAPNHVSDFDGLILGLLHKKLKVVAKIAWTSNEKLKQFLDIHYDLYGLDRASLQSLHTLFRDSVNYFNEDDESKHYLIFSQGTISDFNNNSPERISAFAQTLSSRTNVPIVNVFVEQVSFYHPTRIVFDTPMILSRTDDFRYIWLEREAAMQQSLTPPARMPKLSYKHSSNNKPGDPFFS